MKTKICSKCKREKTLEQFSKGNDKYGLRYECKLCRNEDSKKWHEIHPDYKKEYDKTHREQQKNYRLIYKEDIKNYQQEHKDKIKDYHKKYYQKNQKKIEKQQILYRKNRRHKDINYRILKNLRCRLCKALNGITKLKSTMKLIDCSIEQLKQYLEFRFKLGMTWQNYGKWEIDHIIPCASFNLNKPKEQKKCFHFTNLQPLWAQENRIKKNKI